MSCNYKVSRLLPS